MPQPVLGEQRSIVGDDALIQWRALEDVRDEDGEIVREWDGVTTKVHPISGKQVPDLRGLRSQQVYHRAAQTVRTGGAEAMGLITTNSLRQTQNRQVLQRHLRAEPALRLSLAIADHPWVDRGAAVPISMTVGVRDDESVTPLGRLGVVTDESGGHDQVALTWRYVPRLHADLSGDADLSSAKQLQANEDVSFQGMNLVGKGFRLDAAQVALKTTKRAATATAVRPGWPSDPLDQIAAVLGILTTASAPMDVEAVARRFSRARRDRVAVVARRLAASGLVIDPGGWGLWGFAEGGLRKT